MIVKKSSYIDEFWGAKKRIYEYELEEEYQGEVFDILLKKILEFEIDEIPNELEIDTDEGDFVIDPYEYLSDDEVEELEQKIKERALDGVERV